MSRLLYLGNFYNATVSGRAVLSLGFQPLACWDCEFESRRVYRYLSVENVVCCQVEDYGTG